MGPDDFPDLSPPMIAKRGRFAPETVIGWIESGELAAVNLAKPGSKRNRYRVSEAALKEFFANRSASRPPAPASPPPRRRQRAETSQITEYF